MGNKRSKIIGRFYIMTNEQAIGYVILSAQEMKLDKETIKELEANMKYFFDITAQEEAEDIYNSFI